MNGLSLFADAFVHAYETFMPAAGYIAFGSIVLITIYLGTLLSFSLFEFLSDIIPDVLDTAKWRIKWKMDKWLNKKV